MSTTAYVVPSARGGFPFPVFTLTGAQSSAWTDRSGFIGSMTLNQAISLYWRVKSFQIDLSAITFSGFIESYTWNSTDNQYEVGGTGGGSVSDTLSSPLTLVSSCNSEVNILKNNQSFSGSALSDAANFDIGVNLRLFQPTNMNAGADNFLSGGFTPFQIVKDGDNYYVPYQLQIASNFNSDTYPNQLADPPASPDVGSPVYFNDGSTQYFHNSAGDTATGNTLEVKWNAADITGASFISSDASSNAVKLTANGYWPYGGKYDPSSGAYTG